MSILIKDTNNEDLLRIMLMFSGHEIVEFPDHDMPTVDAVPVVRCRDASSPSIGMEIGTVASFGQRMG